MEVKILLIGLLAVSAVQAGPVKSFDQKSGALKESTAVKKTGECQKRQITVIYDASNALSSSLFEKLQSFVDNELFDNFTDFERLSLGVYDALFQIEGYGVFQSLDDVKSFVDNSVQSTKGAVIRRVLEWVAHNQRYVEGDQTILLLVGSLSKDDIEDSKSPANEIKRFAKLSLIGLQDSVKKANLEKIADYSYVLDLKSPLPDDIQDIIKKAFGC